MPKVKMLREEGKLPTYIPPEAFEAIYEKCKDAKRPAGQNYEPEDWWKALLVTAYMTGWRIGALLALRREDVDLEAGEATSWAKDNKGKRDVKVKLHPVVVDHLRKLPGFDPCIFPWNHNKTTLYKEFFAIQKAAEIKLTCHEQHEHTEACQFYGFHDLRRAFATLNAETLTPDALQALMQHKSYSTTQRYINMARQLDTAVAALHVPEVLKAVN